MAKWAAIQAPVFFGNPPRASKQSVRLRTRPEFSRFGTAILLSTFSEGVGPLPTIHGIRTSCTSTNRSTDTRIFSRMVRIFWLYLSMRYRGARCCKCLTVHNGAQLIPAKFPQGAGPAHPLLEIMAPECCITQRASSLPQAMASCQAALLFL